MCRVAGSEHVCCWHARDAAESVLMGAGGNEGAVREGVEAWNHMVRTILLPCAGLVQYLADAVPPDLAHWDPE